MSNTIIFDIGKIAKEFEIIFSNSIETIIKTKNKLDTKDNGFSFDYIFKKLRKQYAISPIVYGTLQNGGEGTWIFSDPSHMIKKYGPEIYGEVIEKLQEKLITVEKSSKNSGGYDNKIVVLNFTELEFPFGAALGYLFKK